MDQRFLHVAALTAAQPPLADTASAADRIRRLCTAAIVPLRASGVGVTVMGEGLVRGLYAASDEHAERLEELQFSLCSTGGGQGPGPRSAGGHRPETDGHRSEQTVTAPAWVGTEAADRSTPTCSLQCPTIDIQGRKSRSPRGIREICSRRGRGDSILATGSAHGDPAAARCARGSRSDGDCLGSGGPHGGAGNLRSSLAPLAAGRDSRSTVKRWPCLALGQLRWRLRFLWPRRCRRERAPGTPSARDQRRPGSGAEQRRLRLRDENVADAGDHAVGLGDICVTVIRAVKVDHVAVPSRFQRRRARQSALATTWQPGWRNSACPALLHRHARSTNQEISDLARRNVRGSENIPGT